MRFGNCPSARSIAYPQFNRRAVDRRRRLPESCHAITLQEQDGRRCSLRNLNLPFMKRNLKRTGLGDTCLIRLLAAFRAVQMQLPSARYGLITGRLAQSGK
jgi:hypothetical protein